MTVPIGTAMLRETINLSRNCCKEKHDLFKINYNYTFNFH